MSLASSRPDRAARKEQLLLRSAELRVQLGADCAVARPLFGLADRVRAAADMLDRHRSLVLPGLVALMSVATLQPRRAGRMALRILAVTRLALRAAPVLKRVSRWARPRGAGER